MILWIFLGIGSGALFSLLLSGFFNFVQTGEKEKSEENLDAPRQAQGSPDFKESVADLEDKKYESINYQSIGTFFIVFGYLGALLYENDLKLIITVIISGGASLFISIGVSRFGKYVSEREIKEKKGLHHFIGSIGIVTSGIDKDGILWIEVEHLGKTVPLSAKSLNGKSIAESKKIIISDFNDEGIAIISEDIPT
jgi:hypothetical protein